MDEGSRWFKKFKREALAMDKNLRFVRVRYGFYRIYYRSSYVYEVYKEMPLLGYDIHDLDPRFESQKYFEEYEDDGEITRKIKNYVEGYVEAIDTIRTRVYMLRNDKEFNENASKAYQQMVIK